MRERVKAQIAEFTAQHPEFDAEIVAQEVHLSNRGRGPGLSMYTMTACGIAFETPLMLGQEHAADTVG